MSRVYEGSVTSGLGVGRPTDRINGVVWRWCYMDEPSRFDQERENGGILVWGLGCGSVRGIDCMVEWYSTAWCQ